jgi:hypothetical protein
VALPFPVNVWTGRNPRMSIITRKSLSQQTSLSLRRTLPPDLSTETSSIDNRYYVGHSDSVKRHLPIEYAADLTPVVAGEEAGASWNALGIAEIACKLGCAVDFASRSQYGGRASGRTPGKTAGTRRSTGTAQINWYWAKARRTSRLSAWRTHERCRIFGGHGCGLGAGRRPVTEYRPETGSWSAPPGR